MIELSIPESVSCSVMYGFFLAPWTVAHQASLFVGFFQTRILEWVAVSFPTRYLVAGKTD